MDRKGSKSKTLHVQLYIRTEESDPDRIPYYIEKLKEFSRKRKEIVLSLSNVKHSPSTRCHTLSEINYSLPSPSSKEAGSFETPKCDFMPNRRPVKPLNN